MPSTPLFAPGEFFAERTPSLPRAAAVLYLAGVAAVSTGAPYVGRTTGLGLSTRQVVVGVLIGGGVGAATVWVSATVVVYLATAVVGGSGSFWRTASYVGWGFLPLFLGNVLYGAVVWTLYATGQLPAVDPATLQEPLWLGLLNVATSVVVAAWIGYLLTYAIHEARDVAIRHAVVIAGVLVLVNVALSLYSIV